jgi:Uma2 family endonuclease
MSIQVIYYQEEHEEEKGRHMSAQPLWGKPIFVPGQSVTKEDLAKLPEDGSRYELYEGELIQMPPPQEYHGNIAIKIASWLLTHLQQVGMEDHISDTAGFDLTIPGQRDTILAPDVAVAQLPVQPNSGYRKLPPLLAVEIASPSQSRPELAIKAQFYLSVGVKMVWLVWPEKHTIDVWTPPQKVETLQGTDTITGGTVLPGFSCPIARFFPKE